MPVWLRNFQNKVVFNVHLLKLHSTFLVCAARASRFDLSVVCMGSQEIRELNRSYRNVDSPTDVLSFPYHEDLVPGVLPSPERECDYNLGDIILCLPVIAEQCAAKSVRLEHRLPVIVTHGLCHLMGYRHHTEAQWRMMYAREHSLLTVFNNTFGTRLHPLTEPHSEPAYIH